MQQLISLFRRFKYFFLFLFLEFVAFTFVIRHHSYHKSSYFNSANAISGVIYKNTQNIKGYVSLRKENKLLIQENTQLKNQIQTFLVDSVLFQNVRIDTISSGKKFSYHTASIIKNNYTRLNNRLTLNKGSKHGIKPDQGVINASGVIGVVENVSSNYTVVRSILNASSKLNVRLKGKNHFGIMSWDGKEYQFTQVEDFPRQAELRVGDTIITGGGSAFFPKGVKIGAIADFKMEHNQYSDVRVKLFNDMSALSTVYVIQNRHRDEIINLETQNP